LQALYQYLHDRGSFIALDNYNPAYLSIFSRELIASKDDTWEQMVPQPVAELIKTRGYFGYSRARD
jgi:hypothetical protein